MKNELKNISLLIIPGYKDSSLKHWQTIWQNEIQASVKIKVPSWDYPVLSEWENAIEAEVRIATDTQIVVCHSLGCLAFISWWCRQSQNMNLTELKKKISGILLVAPPDPERTDFPKEIVGFQQIKTAPIEIPSILVASTDDPYSNLNFSYDLGSKIRSKVIVLKNSGHINAESGLGDWKFGQNLLLELKKNSVLS